MANFNEYSLELSIMELFKGEGYTYLAGERVHRESTEALLTDDLRRYLYNRYANDRITLGGVDGILLHLRNISGTVYDANKAVQELLCDVFNFHRSSLSSLKHPSPDFTCHNTYFKNSPYCTVSSIYGSAPYRP